MPVTVRPVPNLPALRLARRRSGELPWLVISDLHLGLGPNPERPIGAPGSSGSELFEDLRSMARVERTRGILIVGDVKHPIVGVPRALRAVLFDFFGALLSDGLRVEVVLGNHDVGIEPHLPREVVVHPSEGAVVNGVGLFHGHRWPSPRVLRASKLVAGHLHPGVRFAPTMDEPRSKQRAWVRVDLSGSPVQDREGHRVRARELIVLPAFHPLAGTEALNRERPGRGRTFLYHRFLEAGSARAYLLDGTDVGPIATAHRPDPSNGSPRRALRAN